MPTFCTAEDRRREWELGKFIALQWALRWEGAKDINSSYDGLLRSQPLDTVSFVVEIKQRTLHPGARVISIGAAKVEKLLKVAKIYGARALFVVHLKAGKQTVWVDLALTEQCHRRWGGRTMTARPDAAHDQEWMIDIPMAWFEPVGVKP